MKKIQQYEAMIARNKAAAAEVGDKNDNIDRLHAENMALSVKLHAMQERCAQVADAFAYADVAHSEPYRKVAAAIRALKDKT